MTRAQSDGSAVCELTCSCWHLVLIAVLAQSLVALSNGISPESH